MSDSSREDLQHYVSKWYAREPEMQFAEVFVPADDKRMFHVWGALLHELKHTLFELSDPKVTEIKTAWWADEFQRLSKDKPGHPITQALPELSGAWRDVSSGLIAVMESTSIRNSNTAQAIQNLLPLADALIDVEDRMFRSSVRTSREIFAVHCLLQRLPKGLSADDQAGIPMHLMARHSVSAAQLPMLGRNGLLQDWATELNSVLVGHVAGTLFRRARTRSDQAQLSGLIDGKGWVKASAPMHLWRAWRAAVAVTG